MVLSYSNKIEFVSLYTIEWHKLDFQMVHDMVTNLRLKRKLYKWVGRPNRIIKWYSALNYVNDIGGWIYPNKANITVCNTPYVNDYRFCYCEWEDYFFGKGIILNSSCLFFVIISKTILFLYHFNAIRQNASSVFNNRVLRNTTNKKEWMDFGTLPVWYIVHNNMSVYVVCIKSHSLINDLYSQAISII